MCSSQNSLCSLFFDSREEFKRHDVAVTFFTAISCDIYCITSAKEVMFLLFFVCLFVCLCVSKITQKVMDGFF